MQPRFRTEIAHRDGAVVVALVGELDLLAASESRDLQTIRELASRYDADQVTLDLAELTFLDAAGLTAVVGAARAFGRQQRLRIEHPRRIVRRMLAITNLEELFEVVDDAR